MRRNGIAAATSGAEAVGAARCACGIAYRGRIAHAYNEEAFHYFLEIECKEAQRGRPFVLCLVEIDGKDGPRSQVDGIFAGRLFRALWQTLRETDVVGWYREHRTIGVMLTDLGDDAAPDVAARIADRVQAALRERLPSDAGRRVRLSLHGSPGDVLDRVAGS